MAGVRAPSNVLLPLSLSLSLSSLLLASSLFVILDLSSLALLPAEKLASSIRSHYHP